MNPMRNMMALVVVAGALITAPNCLYAQPTGPGALLKNAYITLSYGNHDYNGHRYYAMREIEAAAHAMKFDLQGDGPGYERQRVSDEQLREARNMLQQARGQLRGRARRHVDKAIREIDQALNVR